MSSLHIGLREYKALCVSAMLPLFNSWHKVMIALVLLSHLYTTCTVLRALSHTALIEFMIHKFYGEGHMLLMKVQRCNT